jgi:hypothetical protein
MGTKSKTGRAALRWTRLTGPIAAGVVEVLDGDGRTRRLNLRLDGRGAALAGRPALPDLGRLGGGRRGLRPPLGAERGPSCAALRRRLGALRARRARAPLGRQPRARGGVTVNATQHTITYEHRVVRSAEGGA